MPKILLEAARFVYLFQCNQVKAHEHVLCIVLQTKNFCLRLFVDLNYLFKVKNTQLSINIRTFNVKNIGFVYCGGVKESATAKL